MRKFRRGELFGIVGAAIFANSAQAAAQTAEQSAGASDEASSIEIIVTAQRRAQRLTDVPISVQAIDARTIERTGVITSIDFIKMMPSVSFSSFFTPAASSVTIRGISSMAAEGGVQPSTTIVMDDVPLSKQGEFVNDFNDIERIEVLRGPQGTLFGKNATAGVINITSKKPTERYEGTIEGGYTTDGEKLVRGTINIPLGDSIRTRFNAFFRDQRGVLINKAPLIQVPHARRLNGERTYGFAAKIAIDLSPTWSALLSGDIYRQKTTHGAYVVLVPNTVPFLAAIQAAAGTVASMKDPYVNLDGGARSTVKGMGMSLSLLGELGDGLTLQSISAYRRYFYDSTSDADGGPWGGWSGVGLIPSPFYPIQYVQKANGGLPRAPDDTRYWSQEIKLNYSNEIIDAVGGIYIQSLKNKRHNSVPYILFFDPAGPGYLDNEIDSIIKDDLYSAYADMTYNLSNDISMFGGARFSVEKLKVRYRNNAYFGSAASSFDPVTLEPTVPPDAVINFAKRKTQKNLSGRVGVRYAPDPMQSYYASYSRGYKGPAADVSRTSTMASAILKPEIADAFEIGTKHLFLDNKMSMNLALFWQQVKDVQQTSVISGSTATRLQNAGKIRSYGAELDVSGQVTADLRVDSSLSFVHAEYRGLSNACYVGQTAAEGCLSDPSSPALKLQDLSGTPAQFQPRFAASLSVTYDVAMPASVPFDMFLRAGVVYNSKVQHGLTHDPLQVQPGYALVDAQIGLTGRENAWQLLLYVKNITNKSYTTYRFEADNFISRAVGYFPRDYKRYGGVSLKANF